MLDRVAVPPLIDKLKSFISRSVVPEEVPESFSSKLIFNKVLSGLASCEDIIRGPCSSPESLIPMFKLIV